MSAVEPRLEPLLEIEDLHVNVGDKPILRGLTLKIGPGEMHAIMGPNGAGKSTLAHFLAGREGYVHVSGTVRFQGRDLLVMPPEERARAGVFLAFQYPVEIPGIGNQYFMRTALNAQRRGRGEEELDAADFIKLIREKQKLVELPDAMLKRSVNDGFSGGEKKRNEMLQMALFEPVLSMLDETDSGLDIDALGTVGKVVRSLRNAERGFLVITHYDRLLSHLEPDFVHVLSAGRIVKSGGRELAQELEEKGYGWLVEGQA